jgi:hypothetical protein
MMAHVMIARCAPAPSSPAQARAATRLRGYDGPDATEPTGLPFHQCTLIDLTTHYITKGAITRFLGRA